MNSIKKLISAKFLLGLVFALMAIFAFNLGQPGVETDTAAAFNKWYPAISARLTQSEFSLESDLGLQVTVSVLGPNQSGGATVWNLPKAPLTEPSERENVARALQLIYESGVFGFSSLRSLRPDSPALSISVRDAKQQFNASVPYVALEGSIQLQNLIKLLEVYSTVKEAPQVEPARL